MTRKKLYRIPDQRTIDPQDEYQLAYWANQMGVSREKLLAAIKSLGTLADDVRRGLKNKYITGRS